MKLEPESTQPVVRGVVKEREGKAQTRLVVAIPAHNEELTIGSVVLRAREHAQDVVVVDDASTDATAKVASAAGARVIRHEQNQGYGGALRTIFKTAREEGWPTLVVLDSDGQHNPGDLPVVSRPVTEGAADVAIGSRFLEKEDREDIPAYRQLGIRVLTGLNNLGARKRHRVTDGQSGFRAYSRQAIETIDPRENDMGISAELLLQAREAGLSFAEVPIRVRYDVDGSSQNPVKHGFGVIGSMIRFVEVEHPLPTFGAAGLVLLLGGLTMLGIAGTQLEATGAIPTSLAVGGTAAAIVGVVVGMTGIFLHAVLNAVRRTG